MKQSIRKEIGALLRLRRMEQRISVRKLASLTGVAYTNISNIERGNINFSIDTLERLADALKLEVNITKLQSPHCKN